MKPYYEHQGITIYHGDCREILPTLPKVNLVLTDPPWNLDFFQDDKKEWEDYAKWLGEIRDLCLDLSEIVWIFQSTKAIGHVAHLFKDWGCFAGVKNFVQMNTGGIPNAWDIAFYNTRKIPVEPPTCRNWHIGNNAGAIGEVKGHPTPRPIDTIKYILLFYSGTVLDPFMGSGTTLRAAKDLNRKGIGIEIEERYCEIAAKRLSQEVFNFQK